MDRTQELEQEVQRLHGQIDEMGARMARLESNPEPKAKRSDRRGFLKLGGAAVMGALGWAAVKIVPAAAATGGYMVLGSSNQADATTALQATSANANPAFGVQAVSFSSAAFAAAVDGPPRGAIQALGGDGGPGFEGIDAFASGPSAFAVYGLTDAGVGVVGESATGIGLYARRSGRILQEALQLAGTPNYTPNLYEQVRDLNGILWIHNGSGVWRRVNTTRVDNIAGTGPFTPARLVDTRNGTGGVTGPVNGGLTLTFQVAGVAGVPADAVAVVGNITATGWNQSGWLTIHPTGVAYNPNADPSSMNFSGTAYAWANSFTIGLGSGGVTAGKVDVYVGILGSGHTNFIIDITGYIQ